MQSPLLTFFFVSGNHDCSASPWTHTHTQIYTSNSCSARGICHETRQRRKQRDGSNPFLPRRSVHAGWTKTVRLHEHHVQACTHALARPRENNEGQRGTQDYCRDHCREYCCSVIQGLLTDVLLFPRLRAMRAACRDRLLSTSWTASVSLVHGLSEWVLAMVCWQADGLRAPFSSLSVELNAQGSLRKKSEGLAVQSI